MNVYFENWEGKGRGLEVTMSGLVYFLIADELTRIKNKIFSYQCKIQ